MEGGGGGKFNIMQMRAKIYAQNCVQRKIYEVSVDWT